MVSVQSTGCAPIIRAFEEGTMHASLWEGAETCADGLRVPVAVGDFLILNALRESGGTAIAVEDAEMVKYTSIMGSKTGIFPAPEGAACLAAQVKLLESGWIKSDETVVLFNTGEPRVVSFIFYLYYFYVVNFMLIDVSFHLLLTGTGLKYFNVYA
jgi:threonine synthase